MDSIDKLIGARFVALLGPPSPVQTCFVSTKFQKLRVAVGATQNSVTPAFHQHAHIQLQESYHLPESPEKELFTQGARLDIAQVHHPDDLFTGKPLPPSSQSSSSIAEYRRSIELPTLELDSYFRNSGNTGTAHEALQKFIAGQNRPQLTEKEQKLVNALRQRREIVKELLMGYFKAVRLRPTFSKGVIENMPEFVDLVMIRAAALKKAPEHVNAPFSYRARLYIEQARVGEKVRWLKRQRFTYSKIGRLVYMVEDHEHNLQPKIKWLKSINVHGSDLATALTRDPIVLEKTIHSLNENVELIKAAGVRSEWIGWVIRRCSKVLACNKEELQEHINFYTRLGIKDDNFGKMVYKFPACLARFSVEEMHSKVLYLKAFGLDDLALGKVIASKPQLIACSIEEDWKPLVKLFYFLGIDGYGLRKILTIQPSVFCLNIKDNIAPKVRFLRDVGVHEELIGDVLVKFPSFLSYSLDEKIRPCVMFLLEKAAVPVDKVGKVLSIQPDLLRCSISQKLDVIVRFFIFHGFKREQVGLMVTDFPMLLKYNLSSIKPKLSFALRVMKLPVEEVVKFPRIFSHSLESRIVPRYKILRKRGLNYNLRRMLACSDDEFMRSLDENGTNDVDTELEMEISVNADLSAETNIEISEQSDLESQFTARYIDDMPDLVMSGQLDVDTSEFRWDNAPNPGAYKVLNGENAVDAGVYEVFDGENLSDEYWHCEFFTDRVRK